MGKDLQAMELATYSLEGHSRRWDSMCQRPEVEMSLECENQQEHLVVRCGQIQLEGDEGYGQKHSINQISESLW